MRKAIKLHNLKVVFFFTDSCDVPATVKDFISFCHDSYSHDEEDKNDWESHTGTFNRSLLSCPENWDYSTDKQLGGFDTWGRFAVYNGGGYIANLGYDVVTARKVIDDLMNNEWIDRQTRAVIVEFSLYNPSSNLLAVMSYYVEVLPSGFAGTFKSYGIVPLTPTNSQAHDIYLFLVLLFGLFLFCYLVVECVNVFRQKCSYFSSLWNWLELFQILSASCALLLQWKKSKEVTRAFAKLKENPFETVNFHQALLLSEFETIIICLTTTTATLRMLKCFYFNAQVIKFSSFMRRHFTSIASFFVIFCVISTGYATFGVIAFGYYYSSFSSFPKAFVSQFLMVVGSSNLIEELEEDSFLLSRLFLFSFMFTTVIITANMFVAVLSFSYSNSCQDNVEQEELAISEFIVNRILQKVFGYTPKETDDTITIKKPTNQFQRKEDLSELYCLQENTSWRSNWSFSAANFTPVMYRSRKISFVRQGTFDGIATVVNSGKDNGAPSVWETCKTKEKLSLTAFKSMSSVISEESISSDSEESITTADYSYCGSDVSTPSSDITLTPVKEKNGHRLITGCSFLLEEKCGGSDDDDDNDDDDDDEYLGDTKDVWKDFLQLLDDDFLNDFSLVGLTSCRNEAAVEDSN